MQMTKLHAVILLIIGVSAFISGRFAVRAFFNLLMGGTLFGGNFL